MSNQCVEIGCFGSCCLRPGFIGPRNAFDAYLAKTQAKLIDHFALIEIRTNIFGNKNKYPGKGEVYYAITDEEKNQVEILVTGDCPLLREHSCSVYGTSVRPVACEMLDLRGHWCNSARQRDGQHKID